jgi:hypothetical protein
MKIYRIIAVIFVFGTFLSCDKDLPTGIRYDNYTFDNPDIKGGTWKPVLLASADQIAIPQPEDISSAAYKTELENIKNAIKEGDPANGYWGSNPILRWNEIARELAAKYNLTPAPNADGTYPAPNPAQPGVYPYFPFAHPPYTARALAYMSAAQFDGMISAWHYKYKYNRPAPHLTDSAIRPLYNHGSLPSYPSDGAVIGAISREILSAMFPLEKEYLKSKSEELKKSLVASGVNAESDIIAGDSLGRGIAKIFLKRASTDGMSKAQTPKAVSDSIANAAFSKFGWKWTNMETPQRPVGIAPFYGKLKTWNIPDITTIRPLPPPHPNSEEFKKAADELVQIQNNLTHEQRKIANWWSDGLGTYTPPGHWNRFATDYIVKYKLNPIRSARVYAYMNMAIHDAGISCWDAKYYYHYPRPIQLIDRFKTILGTPNFPSYTSGHSTFSAAAAAVLTYMFPAEKNQVDQWAKEASDSRIYGGIHFRFDCEAGLLQGKKVADLCINEAVKDGAD